MRRVYLIRHASPAVQPDVPSHQWTLSERGIEEARTLAAMATSWGLRAVYCGSEPKMRATALIIAESGMTPVHAVEAFAETRMSEWIANADDFNALVRSILEGGDPLPRGVESGEEAAARFENGLRMIDHGAFPAAIVSGGRALTSYLSRRRRGIEEPFAFWREIPFPAWTSIDLDAPTERVSAFQEIQDRNSSSSRPKGAIGDREFT